MKKEKRISYEAGITRTPSDFLCKEGELAECVNLTSDGEELKVMVPPKALGLQLSGSGLKFVHKTTSGKVYITEDGGWTDNVGLTGTLSFGGSVLGIQAIGNLLCVATSAGLMYWRWNVNTYTAMPNEIPYPRLRCKLVGGTMDPTHNTPYRVLSSDGLPDHSVIDQGSEQPVVANKEAYNDFVVGLYEEHKKKIAQSKGFCEPFFIRAALKLYDNTYSHISQPILLFPSIRGNSATYISVVDNGVIVWSATAFRKLFVAQLSDYSQWSDIVKDVVLFVTQGVPVYNLSVDQTIYRTTAESGYNGALVDGIYATSPQADSKHVRTFVNTWYGRSGDDNKVYDILKHRERTEIEADLRESSVFYKLCSLGIQKISNYKDLSEVIRENTLEFLTTQDRLTYDDYYSMCPLFPNLIKAYNSRLHLANVKRGFFAGFDSFSPHQYTGSGALTAYIKIETDEGTRVVRTEIEREYPGHWYFYPDPRARQITVYDGTTVVFSAAMTEHPGLNGAFYFGGLPEDFDDPFTPESPDKTPYLSAVDDTPETLDNQIVVSEANNPLLFLAKGYVDVGGGKVRGLAVQTQALGQEEHGQHPLVVFCEDGIWTLMVNSEGVYVRSDAMPREVMLEGHEPLEVDDGIFFVSQKGLMLLAGNSVRCVSERLNGVAFDTDGYSVFEEHLNAEGAAGAAWKGVIQHAADSGSFLKYVTDGNCRMAYDYAESRVILFNTRKTGEVRSYRYAWVYNMKDGAFSKMVMTAGGETPGTTAVTVNFKNAVADYPDYLLEDTDGTVYTLYEKGDESAYEERQLAFLCSRPMKLAGPLAVTSLRELMNVGVWGEASEVKTVLLVSDDLRRWSEARSRFGAAGKYWRVALFMKMLPSERLSGTIVTEQERRGGNER